MRGRALLAAAVVVVVSVAMTLNGIVDPKDEFYSGDGLTAARSSHCLLGDDVVHGRSYPEFKQDLFRRLHRTRVFVGSNRGGPSAVNMSYPGFGPGSLLDTMSFLARVSPSGTRLTVRVTTDPSWFNKAAHPDGARTSFASKVGYLLNPLTLVSTLDLMRRSSTLAFTGWHKEPVGRVCVVDRGSADPAWRADGTFTGPAPSQPAWHGFAWNRLDAVDNALAIAERRRWRVVGISTSPGTAYAREMTALFAKHGYRWRIRRMAS